MEEACFVCNRTEEKVKLLDAISENEIVKICEECSITEDIPIIRKPSSFQLKTNKTPSTVYERLRKLREATQKEKTQDKVQEVMRKITQTEPAEAEQLSIRQRQELARKANQPLILIDNFHWHIQMTRRKKKISANQLAESIGETEEIIKMVEAGNLPDDAKRIIRKIEQYFSINLEKQAAEEKEARLASIKQPSRVLSFDPETAKTLTIADLIKMKKEREAAEKSTEQLDKQTKEQKEKIRESSEENWEKIDDNKQEQEEQQDLTGSDIEFLE